jgi:hypothetical protein
VKHHHSVTLKRQEPIRKALQNVNDELEAARIILEHYDSVAQYWLDWAMEQINRFESRQCLSH